jgi:hypothetical protein
MVHKRLLSFIFPMVHISFLDFNLSVVHNFLSCSKLYMIHCILEFLYLRGSQHTIWFLSTIGSYIYFGFHSDLGSYNMRILGFKSCKVYVYKPDFKSYYVHISYLSFILHTVRKFFLGFARCMAQIIC